MGQLGRKKRIKRKLQKTKRIKKSNPLAGRKFGTRDWEKRKLLMKP